MSVLDLRRLRSGKAKLLSERQAAVSWREDALREFHAAATDLDKRVAAINGFDASPWISFEQLLKARVEGYRGEKEDAERASQLFLASFASGEVMVNLLDAPGHPDFVGELRAGIRAADAAIFVLSAADGIDGAAQALWEECREANLPRVIVLTKLDAGHADFDTSVEECQSVFGEGVRPTHVPTFSGPNQVSGNIGLLSLEEHDYSGGAPVSRTLNAHDDQVETYRGPLIESIIQEAEDDGLMDRYLEDDEHLDVNDLLDDLMKAVATANLFPVVPVQTGTGVIYFRTQ